jgi:hypothetical protein
VKVGTSTNLRRRMGSFYRSLEDVVLAVAGDEREESAFHEKFASRVDLDGRPGTVLGPWPEECYSSTGNCRACRSCFAH